MPFSIFERSKVVEQTTVLQQGGQNTFDNTVAGFGAQQHYWAGSIGSGFCQPHNPGLERFETIVNRDLNGDGYIGPRPHCGRDKKLKRFIQRMETVQNRDIDGDGFIGPRWHGRRADDLVRHCGFEGGLAQGAEFNYASGFQYASGTPVFGPQPQPAQPQVVTTTTTTKENTSISIPTPLDGLRAADTFLRKTDPVYRFFKKL